MKKLAKYTKLCVNVGPILLAFLDLYMVKSRFNYVHYLLSKQRSTLNIEHDDLQLKLTNMQLNVCDLLSAHQTHPFH